LNVPEAVGVPLMVTVLLAQLPLTPAGSPLTVAPVAPVVVYVILVIAVLIQRVWLFVPAAELNVIVLFALTLIVPVAFTLPHPPVSGIV
jgi:hypothetical protein